MTANSLVEYDRAHWIHPVASWRDHEERGATILRSGKGAYLTDIEGRELLDGFAGLWCVNIGYGQESVVAAATEQMRRLPYATGYRSEEHTSELQSLMRISYAVFCLKKKHNK